MVLHLDYLLLPEHKKSSGLPVQIPMIWQQKYHH
jgi:hypothetical protein